jgi:hypothetical protein
MNDKRRQDRAVGNKIISDLFEPKIHDMGGGLRIVSLKKDWLTVEARDLIVRAVQQYIRDEP